MEDQIKSSLITLHKIAGFTSVTRIDTTSGDTDEFVDTFTSKLHRAIFDNRQRARDVLLSKYRAVKEHTKYIMQSNDPVLLAYLPQIRNRLEKTRDGLTLYMNNPLYSGDGKIKSCVEHLLQEEIPGQLNSINEFLDHK